MSMDKIRRYYGVPAKRGARVRYTGEGADKPEFGTITGTSADRRGGYASQAMAGGSPMTDEQNERAARVWREAIDATGAFIRFKAKADQAATAVIAREFEADRARIEVLEGDKAALVKHSIETLERWQLYGEACGILSGWLALTDDPEHLALLRKNTEAFLARAALKDTNA